MIEIIKILNELSMWGKYATGHSHVATLVTLITPMPS